MTIACRGATRKIKQIKVSFFLQTLAKGGAEKNAIRLANDLASKGFTVEIILASGHGPLVCEVSPKVRIVNFDLSGVMVSLPALVAHLRKARPDKLIAFMTHAGVVALLAKKLSGIKTEIYCSERNVTPRSTPGFLGWKQWILRWAARFFYRQADGIFAVSRAVQEDLFKSIKIPPQKVRILPNPVVSEDVWAMANHSCPHRWLKAGQPPVILAAGRLTAQKNFSDLIMAFEIVRAKRRCRLVLLGEGELRRELKNQIQASAWMGDILLAGYQANPFSWMRRAKVFVLSSLWEGLPGVLIQAMACGTRVISTDCPGGSREILEDGKWGELVSPRNSSALAEAIHRALRNGPSREALRRRAGWYSLGRSVQLHLEALGLGGCLRTKTRPFRKKCRQASSDEAK